MSDEPGRGAPAPHQGSAAAHNAARRLRLVVAGTVTTGLLTLGGLVLARQGSPEQPGGDATAPSSSAGARDAGRAAIPGDRGWRDEVVRLLDQRARALLRHDRAAFLATVDPDFPRSRARQASWFDNLADVPLASWHHRLGDPSRATLWPDRVQLRGVDAFAAPIEVEYRLDGHDRVPQRFEQTLTFDRRDGRWLVVGDSDGDVVATGTPAGSGQRQLWDFGPVQTVSTRYGLVLGLGSKDALRVYAREIDRAVPRVLSVWRSRWSGQVVVVVPRTEAQMAALLGGRASQYAQLAAITRGELGTTEDSAPADRVFINPTAFGKLSAVGRQVIMAHEITHVASRAQTHGWTPRWLSEGLADYVGYRTSGLPTRVVAQELATDVRRGELPRALPRNDAFATTSKDLPQVYEQAWLACRLIAQRYGQQALVRFYRSVGRSIGEERGDGSAAVDRAFREVLGTTQRRFTRDWRAYVERQLR